MARAFRVGVGGPVGSGKSALVERLVPYLLDAGLSPAIIANDVFTTEDERILRRGLAGVLEEDRIIGVETGSCPHTAVREDPTLNLMAIEDLERSFPETDVILVESGGDNLTLTFSPLLADVSIYVMDVSGGEKMPRKQGPGMLFADLLVINKADLAPHVGASLSVMDRDARALRRGPVVFTNCRTGDGLSTVAAWLVAAVRAHHGDAPGSSAATWDATPVPMPAAEMLWRADGRPDWGAMWQDFCGLAFFGGPPHRGEEDALRGAVSAEGLSEMEDAPFPGFDPIDEIMRGINETTGLATEVRPGGVAVRCASTRMAAWMAATMILEHVDARAEGDCLMVPAEPWFGLTSEVKSVITVVAKTRHYWQLVDRAA